MVDELRGENENLSSECRSVKAKSTSMDKAIYNKNEQIDKLNAKIEEKDNEFENVGVLDLYK